jgi:hypothetical protein
LLLFSQIAATVRRSPISHHSDDGNALIGFTTHCRPAHSIRDTDKPSTGRGLTLLERYASCRQWGMLDYDVDRHQQIEPLERVFDVSRFDFKLVRLIGLHGRMPKSQESRLCTN